MKSAILITFTLLLLLSCEQISDKNYVDRGWVKRGLCEHWTIWLPSGTLIERQGCTTDLKTPGIIKFNGDSLRVNFHAVSFPLDNQSNCTYADLIRKAKENSSDGICQGDGPSYELSPYINYAKQLAGVLGRATDSGRYFTTFQISHCPNHDLSLKFESLSPFYVDIADKIIRSIKFEIAISQK